MDKPIALTIKDGEETYVYLLERQSTTNYITAPDNSKITKAKLLQMLKEQS